MNVSMRRRVVLVAAIALLAIAPDRAWPRTVQADSLTFIVTSTADAHDAHPGDGICADQAGQCTLRAASEEVNYEPGGSVDTVVVPTGTYTLTLGSLTLLTNTIAITGAGASKTIIAGAGSSRVALVGAHSTATFDGVTITRGYAGQDTYGGGILSAGNLTLRYSVVSGNYATAAGGGVDNSGGALTVERSIINGNTGFNYGGGGLQNGGLKNLPGTVVVRYSVVENNMTTADGGGILNGQNGHPPDGAAPALAVDTHCARIPLCARAAGLASPRAAAGDGRTPLASTLSLTVTASRIGGNEGDNGGGGIANDGGTTLLQGSTVDGNRSPSAIGGGLFSSGSLTVTGSTVSRNQSVYGAGIETYSGVDVISSTISQNTGWIGGGIDVGGFVSVAGSTLSGNTVVNYGGAMEVEGAAMSFVNSTLSGNVAPAGQGGGIQTYACGGGTLSYVTLAGNSSALALSCPDVTLNGTIVANSTSGANCAGAQPVEGAGYNLDSGTSCGFGRTTDLTSTNPLLGPLAHNGGPTKTLALLAGSPAIDAGGTPGAGCPGTDQRGVPRPQGPACDIGAFEARR